MITLNFRGAARRIAALILVVILGGVSMFGLFGCNKDDKKGTPDAGGATYRVDYCGQKDYFTGAKDEYKAGEKVTVYYEFIATDTDYRFTLDDEKLNCLWDEEHGYVIEFTMPDHDVKLECHSKNSMVYEPYSEGDVVVDYYIGTVGVEEGNSYRELTLSYINYYEAKLEVITYSPSDEDEKIVEYVVPYEAVEMCFDAIDEEGLRSWADLEDYESLDGGLTAVRFLEENGEMIRVSTERMPEDGERALDRIGAIMAEYIRSEYLVDNGGSN